MSVGTDERDERLRREAVHHLEHARDMLAFCLGREHSVGVGARVAVAGRQRGDTIVSDMVMASASSQRARHRIIAALERIGGGSGNCGRTTSW